VGAARSVSCEIKKIKEMGRGEGYGISKARLWKETKESL
jgi:hypothetical protein